jgi:hypothetical protein
MTFVVLGILIYRLRDLAEIADTDKVASRSARLVESWQEQRDQDGNDADHDKQLDERKSANGVQTYDATASGCFCFGDG